MVARHATEAAFNADVEQARKNMRAGTHLSLAQAFGSAQRMSVSMERLYKFRPTLDFERVFGMAAKNIFNVDIVSLTDEWGHPQDGVLFTDDSSPFRQVRVSWQAETQLNNELLQPSSVIRQEQAAEFSRWWNEAVMRAQPAAVQPKAKPANGCRD